MNRSISVVIPAYNEECRLPATLERVLKYFENTQWDFAEIIVVDDGSEDGTAAVAGRYTGVRVLVNPGNRGKGYSVRHGMMAAKGEWVLFTDADMSTPIEELELLWNSVERCGGAIGIGSRALDRSLIKVRQPGLRESGGKLFNYAVQLVTRLPFRDTQCGFKLFDRGAATQIFSRQILEGFAFDVEVLFIAQCLGYKVLEVPVRWNHMEGTKVKLIKDSLEMALDLLRIRWNHIIGRYTEARTPEPRTVPYFGTGPR